MTSAMHMDAGALVEDRRRSGIGLLVLVLFIALGVRVYRAGTLGSISRDGVFLVTFAKQLGDRPAFYIKEQTKQPGYSAMLLATHRLMGANVATDPPLQWERCGQAISILGGVAGVGLLYLFARGLFSHDTAIVASFVAAFWSNHVLVSSDVLTDAPHLAIYLLALWIGSRAIERGVNLPLLIVCGVLAGVAYLIRQEAMGVPIAVSVMVAASREQPIRRRIVGCGWLLGAFVLVVSPLVAITGTIMHNKSIWDMLTGKTPEVVAAPSSLSIAAVVSPWTAPWRIFVAWCESGRYVISLWTIIALAWPAVRPAQARLARLVAIAVLLQLVATQLRGARHGEISQRYLMIPVALSIPWAAEALRQAAIALRRMQRGKLPQLIRFVPVFADPPRRAPLIGLVLVSILISPMIWFCLRPTPKGADAPRRAGRWLAEHAAPGDRILTPREMSPVPFYANLPHEWPFDAIGQPIPAEPAQWFIDRIGASPLPADQTAYLDSIRKMVSGAKPIQSWQMPGSDLINVHALTLAAEVR